MGTDVYKRQEYSYLQYTSFGQKKSEYIRESEVEAVREKLSLRDLSLIHILFKRKMRILRFKPLGFIKIRKKSIRKNTAFR